MRFLRNFTLNLKFKGQSDPQGRRENFVGQKAIIKPSPIAEPAPSFVKHRPRQYHDIDAFVVNSSCLQQILARFKNAVIARDKISLGIDQTNCACG